VNKNVPMAQGGSHSVLFLSRTCMADATKIANVV